MKKSTLCVLGALVLFFTTAMWLLKSYSLELIQIVVEQHLIQKAPPDYPSARIQSAFQKAVQEAVQSDREKAYRNRLLSISQRLEKIQELDAVEVNELLDSLDKEKPY